MIIWYGTVHTTLTLSCVHAENKFYLAYGFYQGPMKAEDLKEHLMTHIQAIFLCSDGKTSTKYDTGCATLHNVTQQFT